MMPSLQSLREWLVGTRRGRSRGAAGVPVRTDAVPAAALEAARAAFAYRLAGDDLAEKVQDTAPRPLRLAPRRLRFVSPRLQVDVAVRAGPRGRTVTVDVRPARAGVVELHRAGMPALRRSCPRGTCRFPAVAPGPTSLLVEQDGARTRTAWVLV